ncbi:TPA: hypothetical protein I7678_11205 [Vibrio vulnificus]|uniref:hypothetical protein n=1 Tax=Vibrio TaxID=662 RepID=UPI0005767B83|nr:MULTISPECIES: hypothetical protein [Vibrio]EGQ7964899.1 hypothetical protein [Vibrio vulnificus]ELP6985704.1 hypothetical protein [Vibrio vulnificus]MCA3879300.1 hypothetical protein [Vibrio vulnificus]MCA3945536.1 hypothetical protein [Vibrio vulnificus]OZT85320.1 hypothetical protein CIK04_08240 [Vibrio sp. 03_296]
MSEDKLKRLKTEVQLLEQILKQESSSSENAVVALKELEGVFNQVKSMNQYYVLGRIRLDRLFIEGDLANNIELADCYSRFANLAEGLEV